jgi:hypothetical protein
MATTTRALRIVGLALGVLAALLALGWGALALHYHAPLLGGALPIVWLIGGAVLLVSMRPPWRGLAAVAALFALLLIWWSAIAPRNDRDWQADVAQLPTGTLDGDILTLHNVRNFDYRSETDFTPRWETRTYDLAQLTGLDLFMSYWGSPSIAHTILSWNFADGQHLAISIETRKQVGESYSAVAGFFKQYELYYVVADERDVIRVRTNHRGEDVYLYHLRTPADRARAILLDYVESMNALAAEPAWYNAATHNCTTTIRTHVQRIGIAQPWDWRILVNGYADQMLYERGGLDTSLPFADLRARSLIDPRAQAADQDPHFSERIREGLPNPQRGPVSAPPPRG